MDFTITRKTLLFQLIMLINGVQLITGICKNNKIQSIPTAIYDDLKCIPIYESDDCIKEYDCSHIYKKPKSSCHFKGKFYPVGEQIDNEELTGVWDRDCECSESLEFSCPELTDGCAEDWVGGYPKPECYLRYELNRYCAVDEICPPFDNLRKCEVEGTVYREGDKFKHPHKKCTECVCDKHFNGSLDPPFCQQVNCTSEIHNSQLIDKHCAPFYKRDNDGCCPNAWVCASEELVITHVDVDHHKDQKCKLGDTEMNIGGSLTMKDKEFGDVKCECNIPPYLNCFPNK